MGVGVFGIGTRNDHSMAEELMMQHMKTNHTGSLLAVVHPQHSPMTYKPPQMSKTAPDGSGWHPEEPTGYIGGASIKGAIHNINDGSVTQIRAKIDQGNNIHPGMGISEKFFRKMKMGYAQEAKNCVTTATMESNLTWLGLTDCFILKLEGIALEFGCQSVVM